MEITKATWEGAMNTIDALRRRAEQAERERDALKGKLDEARDLGRKYVEMLWGEYNDSSLQGIVDKWDAERTAAVPHGDAANEAEQEAQTHYP